jgi:protein TonB
VNATVATPLLDELERLREGRPPVRDRMTTTLFLVAILHAILILGVTFGGPHAPAGTGAPSLEVLVVQDPVAEDRVNEHADYLAQVNQRGAGTSPAAHGAVTPKSAAAGGDADPAAASGAADGTGRAEATPGDGDLVATRTPQAYRRWFAPAASPAEAPRSPLVLQPLSLDASGADEGDALRLKGKAQHELLVTANTRESSVAVYLDAWRRKIERIGTLNYPMDVIRRGRMTGNPVLEVQILGDGTLGQAIVRRSSGFPELDQAAVAILKMAAPYEPFPARLARQHDALRLVYEWQFLGGELEDGSVRMPADTK